MPYVSAYTWCTHGTWRIPQKTVKTTPIWQCQLYNCIYHVTSFYGHEKLTYHGVRREYQHWSFVFFISPFSFFFLLSSDVVDLFYRQHPFLWPHIQAIYWPKRSPFIKQCYQVLLFQVGRLRGYVHTDILWGITCTKHFDTIRIFVILTSVSFIISS